MQEEKNLTQDQSEKLVEKQIYDGFPDNKDNYLMQEFHAAKSEDKFDIAEKITDHRYKEFAKRVMFNEYPEFLPKKELTKRNKVVAENHLTLEERPWCTIPQAMQAIDDLREEEKEVDLDRLEEIDEFIIEMKEKFERDIGE